MVRQLLPMILRDGHVTRSALGVQIIDPHQLSSEDRQALKLGDDKLSGAIIAGVAPGGPADRAGLQAGDFIVGFDGTRIERSAQLQWLASTAGVGRAVTLRVQREGKPFDIRVTLGQLPDQTLNQTR
jgi:serine protease Do